VPKLNNHIENRAKLEIMEQNRNTWQKIKEVHKDFKEKIQKEELCRRNRNSFQIDIDKN
jgi:hypothetical protein